MRVPEAPPSDSYVHSFARGLSVIRSFGPNSPRQTLSQVAAKTGLDRAGARRILLTLAALGYVGREGRDFYLTPRILDLGYAYLSSMPLWNIAEPVMEDLVRTVHESSSAAVLDGAEIVYIVRVPVRKIMTINLAIGSRLPAYCTAMGRVLLGGLSEDDLDRFLKKTTIVKRTKYTVTSRHELKRIIHHDRDHSWSLVNQELEEGLCSISVPIFNRDHRVIAAMNVSGNVSRTSATEMVNTILPHLKRAAERINMVMRHKD